MKKGESTRMGGHTPRPPRLTKAKSAKIVIPPPPNAPVVTIFGAGIGGLTAAHELIERGFIVQVVEKRESLFEEGCCEIGGVAATQWSFLSVPALTYGEGRAPMAARAASSTFSRQRILSQMLGPAANLPYRIYFQLQAQGTGWTPTGYDPGFRLGPRLESPPNGDERIENLPNAKRIEYLAKALAEFVKAQPSKPIKVHVVGHVERTVVESDARRWSADWATQVITELETRLENTHNLPPGRDIEFQAIGMGSLEPVGDDAFPDGRARNNRVELHVAGVLFPGDHGYRFFPAFYRNLDDSMKRTPLYDTSGEETGQSVLSKLKGTREVAVATNDGQKPILVPRRRARSFEELREMTAKVLDRLEYTPKDIALLQLQLFRFLTMSRERRTRELDGTSWYDYIRGDLPGFVNLPKGDCPRCGRRLCHHHLLPFSKNFLRDLDKLPQAMAGMRAKESDAHTNAVVSVQMLIDQMGDGSGVDRLLEGPTSESWLGHWKRYLRQQGVRFFVGELTELRPIGGQEVEELVPVVVGIRAGEWAKDANGNVLPPVAEPGFADEVSRGARREKGGDFTFEEQSDFYVAALPANVLQKLVKPIRKPLHEPLESLKTFDLGTAFDAKRYEPPTGNRFRDISGLQFYFANDFHFAEGHNYYADSPWRLTSVSQLQFWRQRRTTSNGYLGILSIDIGEMHSADASASRWAHFTLQGATDALRESLKSAPDASLDALLNNCIIASNRSKDLMERAEAYARELTVAAREAGATPWIDAEKVRTAIANRLTRRTTPNADSVVDAIDGIRSTLQSGNPPTAAQLLALGKAIDSATSARPPSVGAELWEVWYNIVRSLLELAMASANAGNLPRASEHAISALDGILESAASLTAIAFAWHSTPLEIAQSVWRQIKTSLWHHARAAVPDPLFFRVDDGIEFDLRTPPGPATRFLPVRNRNPYFINEVGGFDDRPGVLPAAGSKDRFYQIAHHRWLPVGSVMKTHTRITSMEHSNESARHAVRAILHALVSQPRNAPSPTYRGQGEEYGDFPRYWNPSNHELDELSFLRRIDEILIGEQPPLPHMVDILGLEEAVIRWMAGEGEEPRRNFAELLGALRHQINRDFAGPIGALEKAGEPWRDFVETLLRMGMQR